MKQDFHSLYAHGFVRLAAATPKASVGDPAANAAAILKLAQAADAARAAVVVFPELSLSAYAIDDLLHQEALLLQRLGGGHAAIDVLPAGPHHHRAAHGLRLGRVWQSHLRRLLGRGPRPLSCFSAFWAIVLAGEPGW